MIAVVDQHKAAVRVVIIDQNKDKSNNPLPLYTVVYVCTATPPFALAPL